MKTKDSTAPALDIEIRREIDRYNARLRHCAAVVSGVLDQAHEVWEELWADTRDPRTPEEIIEGKPLGRGELPRQGWPSFLERLHLLGYYLEYSRRLLAGSVPPEAGPSGEGNQGEEER